MLLRRLTKHDLSRLGARRASRTVVLTASGSLRDMTVTALRDTARTDRASALADSRSQRAA